MNLDVKNVLLYFADLSSNQFSWGIGALSLLFSAQHEHTELFNPDALNLGVQHEDVASK